MHLLFCIIYYTYIPKTMNVLFTNGLSWVCCFVLYIIHTYPKQWMCPSHANYHEFVVFYYILYIPTQNNECVLHIWIIMSLLFCIIYYTYLPKTMNVSFTRKLSWVCCFLLYIMHTYPKQWMCSSHMNYHEFVVLYYILYIPTQNNECVLHRLTIMRVFFIINITYLPKIMNYHAFVVFIIYYTYLPKTMDVKGEG